MRLRPMRWSTAITPAPFFFSAAGAVAVDITFLQVGKAPPGDIDV
jgi:hypothetical protein